ncbi:Uncharacterized protein dnm_059690 [Desulfonema magnum]|uniref:Uncharacterized protein n=1 Tax=Desulfonema magnum TaxID=45655 RepID=A0A975GQH5_9BACT|nr:Uncharacterized protein dnm_059690 [Desulfonema magnum]
MFCIDLGQKRGFFEKNPSDQQTRKQFRIGAYFSEKGRGKLNTAIIFDPASSG